MVLKNLSVTSLRRSRGFLMTGNKVSGARGRRREPEPPGRDTFLGRWNRGKLGIRWNPGSELTSFRTVTNPRSERSIRRKTLNYLYPGHAHASSCESPRLIADNISRPEQYRAAICRYFRDIVSDGARHVKSLLYYWPRIRADDDCVTRACVATINIDD